ncbi:MAG: flavin reductase family protein [Microbacterium sp.]
MTSVADDVPGVPADARYFRDVLGNFPTSVVAIATVDPDGEPVGMVVGSFTSVSLDPPLVAFLADEGSSTLPRILARGRFCANVFAGEQEALSRRMAKRGADRFSGVAWHPSPLGNPIIDGVVAWVDCEIDRTVGLGDHTLVVGRVAQLRAETPGATPLLFFRGEYGNYHSTTALLLDRLLAG